VAVTCYIKQADRHEVTVQYNVRMGKISNLRNFEHGMIFGAMPARSSISETAGLLGISRTTVSRVYREWCDKQKNIQSASVLWAKTARW
jgi:hypothetical protein